MSIMAQLVNFNFTVASTIPILLVIWMTMAIYNNEARQVDPKGAGKGSRNNEAPYVPPTEANKGSHNNEAPYLPFTEANKGSHNNEAPYVPPTEANKGSHNNEAPYLPLTEANKGSHNNEAPYLPPTEGSHESPTPSLTYFHYSDSYADSPSQDMTDVTFICVHNCSCTVTPQGTVRTVDCSGLALYTCPKLPSAIVTLVLRNNRITHVKHSDFSQVQHLSTLDLSGNDLSTLPDGVFVSHYNLTSLNLSRNKITRISSQVFQGLGNLYRLDLSHNNLHILSPHSFKNLPMLRHLLLLNCSLSKIVNDTFLGLNELELLDLSKNRLSYFQDTFEPRAFRGLVKLKTLQLGYNNYFDDLNLSINLEKDHYSAISPMADDNITVQNQDKLSVESFKSLNDKHEASLKTIDYSYPDVAISELQNLEKIHLDGIPESVLGAGFYNLKKLTSLEFSESPYCKMGDLRSDMFHALRALQTPLTLKMVHCSIGKLPSDLFSPVDNIVSLDLSQNEGIHLVNMSLGLSKSTLSRLIADNVFKGFDGNHLSHEVFVNLYNTPLTYLSFAHNRLSSLYVYFFVCLPKTLQVLDMSWNYLMNASPLLFVSCMENVKEIDLSHQIHFHTSPPGDKGEETQGGKPRYRNSPYKTKNLEKLALSEVVDKEFSCPDVEPDRGIEFKLPNLQFKCHCPYLRGTKTDHKAYSDIASMGIYDQPSQFARAQDTQINRTDLIFKTGAHKSALSGKNAQFSNSLKLKTKKQNVDNRSSFFIPFPKSLEVLRLSDMNLRYSIPGLKFLPGNSLRHFEFATNRAFCWDGPVENANNINYLDLSDNRCREFNPDFFKSFPNLTTLLLNLNTLGHTLSLESHAKVFFASTKLERIEIRSNLLTGLPMEMFVANTHLQMLDLSNNFISKLDLDLQGLTRLELLNLSYNVELRGFSPFMTHQFDLLKNHLQVDLKGISLVCNCDNIRFLHFLCAAPNVFVQVNRLNCSMPSSFRHKYKSYPSFCSDLDLINSSCLAQTLFPLILVAFFLMTSSILVSGIISCYRWKLTYLYYIGRKRMHMGNQHLSVQNNADVFLTYDQDDINIRRLVQQVFLPHITSEGISVLIGERDFPPGNELDSIPAAIIGCKKILVLLSPEIFDDSLREFEFNMAVMHEMRERSQLLVVVYVEPVADIYAVYPSVVASFLDNQHERCLRYYDHRHFWTQLLKQLRMEQ